MIEGASISDVRVHELIKIFLNEPVKVITVLLQVSLPLLEEVLANVAKVSVLIEAEGIGPFQNLTALNDSLAAVLQELKLLGRIVLRLVKHIDFVLNHGE